MFHKSKKKEDHKLPKRFGVLAWINPEVLGKAEWFVSEIEANDYARNAKKSGRYTKVLMVKILGEAKIVKEAVVEVADYGG